MAEAKTNDSVIQDALERFQESQSGSSDNRQAAYDDIKFARLGEQWPDKIKKQRELEGRPCLTINKLPAFVRQVVNEGRQNRPAIRVSPVDSGADVATAEVLSGLIKSIERGSNAEIAYDTALDHAVSCGMGFFRVSIDHAHEDSFDLEARIERIANPLMVHWDTRSTEFDASDWEFAFVSDFLTQDEFKKRYPKASPVNFESGDRDQIQAWIEDEQVRVAEYWLRTESKRKLVLVQFPDGSTRAVRADDIPNILKKQAKAGGLDLGGMLKDDELMDLWLEMVGGTVLREREATYHEVTRRIMSGVEVLEEDKWPGSTIPICPVWGEEVFIDGRRHFRSLIRDARDPQAMFNFWRTSSTELVALAPRAPWLIEEGSLPNDATERAKWATANTRNHSALLYRQGAQRPTREAFAGVPAGALQEAMNASDDIKAITGIYDTSLGARSNETSGKAILARQREADNANFHFIDNLSRAIRYAGRVLVEIIPSVYSPQETIRILGEDMKEKVVNLTQEDGGSDQTGIDGQERLYNLSVGKYDVTVSTGPSFATQREETRETLIEIMRSVPQSATVLADVVLEHMDFPGADKVAQRMKALLPPQLAAAEGVPGAMSPQMPGQPMQGAPMMGKPDMAGMMPPNGGM